MTEAKPPPTSRRAPGTKMPHPAKAKVAQRKAVKRPAKSPGRKEQPPPAPPVVARKPAPATPHPSTVQAKPAGPQRGAAGRSGVENDEKKKPSFAQLTESAGGKLLFSSKRSDILKFLQRRDLPDWGGMCAALVLMWLGQRSSKIAPSRGAKNKVRATELLSELEGSWESLDSIEQTGTKLLGNFWWKSKKMHAFDDFSDPAPFLQNNPKDARDGLHVLVLYFDKGPAHAIGVWRSPPSGTMVLYDPNEGACSLSARSFPKVLASVVEGIYGEGLKGWAVCSFWRKA